MTTYDVNRTIRRRKGTYSQFDIHAEKVDVDSGSTYHTIYWGSYKLSKSKSMNITETKVYKIASYEVYRYIGAEKIIYEDDIIYQNTTVQVVSNPNISIDNDLGVIGDACSIKYNIYDSNPDVSFKITVKLNDVVISEKNNTVDSNYTIDLTDEHLSNLVFNSVNNITIELGTVAGGKMLDKTVTFTKGNTKPKLNISSYNSTTAIFTAIDTDNNLSKIEWFIDDVLKDTFTTDLTAEKTINYELTDNAIHTLKIVAADAENATAEKVLSISKEIMPLQSDATLQDISSKLVEIGEGFINGKTSIINTLALKNIEANLNNTLVELSEKIKTSFDSSDASVEELQNRITELNNQLSQRIKWASGTFIASENTNLPFVVPINLTFVPKIIIMEHSNFIDSSSPRLSVEGGSISNLNNRHFNASWVGSTRVSSFMTSIENISESSFTVTGGSINSAIKFPVYLSKGNSIKWYAFDAI
ncbi:hypothetical protein ABRY17_15385 [Clostridioides difficile]